MDVINKWKFLLKLLVSFIITEPDVEILCLIGGDSEYCGLNFDDIIGNLLPIVSHIIIKSQSKLHHYFETALMCNFNFHTMGDNNFKTIFIDSKFQFHPKNLEQWVILSRLLMQFADRYFWRNIYLVPLPYAIV